MKARESCLIQSGISVNLFIASNILADRQTMTVGPPEYPETTGPKWVPQAIYAENPTRPPKGNRTPDPYRLGERVRPAGPRRRDGVEGRKHEQSPRPQP